MRFSLAAAASVAVFLSACGGSTDSASDETGDTTGGTDGGTEEEVVIDTGPAHILLEGDNQATRLEYDSDADQIIVEKIPFDDEVFESRLDRTASRDESAYRAYSSKRGFDDYTAYTRETDSGAVSVIVVNSGEYKDHGYSGAAYTRTGTTTLPTENQRAFYEGEYLGTRTSEESGGMDVIVGDAELEADFSDDTIRGRITKRRVTEDELGVGAGTDITLANTAIDRSSGVFNGSVSQTNDDVTSEGTYSGILGGDNADETAGYLILERDATRELGVFTAVER
ncbi:hypothetical protein [Neptunicoccus sediminis]|uniref:hypothetical protein n=1 Tax=Neptunicoccus sediminis TaxID=1892596 RepID=UPI000845D608|nr:hypothetical protein [Neptunicoccus sediminis]